MSVSKEPFRFAYQVAFEHNHDVSDALKQRIFVEQVARIEKALKSKQKPTRKVLVMGAAGYIGGMVSQTLHHLGYEVTAADLLLYENEAIGLFSQQPPQSRFHRVDLRSMDELKEIVTPDMDVIWLAALVGDPISKKYPEQSIKINEQSVFEFLDTYHDKIGRFVFASTCSNYGLQDHSEPLKETDSLNPQSIYARNKVAVEKYLLEHHKNWDCDPTILRFATAFGVAPRMRFDLTVNQFAHEMFHNKDLVVYDPDTWRPYCHVRDFAEVIRRVLEFPQELVSGEVFNVGSDQNNYTKRSIVTLLQEYLPDAPVRYQLHGSDPRNYRVDFSKIREVLQFTPGYSVKDGVEELLMLIRQGLFRDVEKRPNFYGNRSIPLFASVEQ